MAQELDDLVERARTAALEAMRLIEINLGLQARLCASVRRMSQRAIFDANDRRAIYPQDLREPLRPIQLPAEKPIDPVDVG